MDGFHEGTIVDELAGGDDGFSGLRENADPERRLILGLQGGTQEAQEDGCQKQRPSGSQQGGL